MKRLVSLLVLAGCWTSSPPPPPARPEQQPVKDLVQPVQLVQQEGGCAGDDCDDPCGVAGGVVGGTSAPPPPPPPPLYPPQNVPPTAFEANRIAGTKEIFPDDLTKLAIARAGKEKVIASFKLCVDVTGSLTSAVPLKSSGFADYDQKILSAMHTGWRYRPYLINGTPAPVCTAVTFIYSQPLAPPPPPKP